MFGYTSCAQTLLEVSTSTLETSRTIR